MRILSGIQPTGQYHIGNYVGAIKHWVRLQEEHDSLIFIADLHALTLPQDPAALRRLTQEKAADLLALGMNPERCTIFVQSHVQEHAELAWILSTIVPIGELERMTQYKDKSKKAKDAQNAGLLNYPVLQAADILLYKTQGIPVGKDQVQHLELTRTIAKKFNKLYGEIFPVPEAMVPKEGAKILSLTNPKKKMSKSDSPDSQIGIFEEPESLMQKIMRATTDTGKEIRYDAEKKPGISNLLTMYSLLDEEPIAAIEKKFKGKGYAAFKKATAELLASKLEPFRRKRKELQNRELYVKEILKQGAARAKALAAATMAEVREKVGLLQA